VTEDVHVIRIKSDFSMTLDTIQNGIVSTKAISPHDLEKAFLNSMVDSKTSSGLLPQNCVSWAKSSKGDTSYYVILHKEEYADIQYHNTKYQRFPIPRLVFGFQLSGNKIFGVNLGVIGKGELSEDTEMYHYPFSNVSGFRMCTGSNKLPDIKKITSLANLPYYIMSIPDNDDQYHSSNNKLNLGHRELLEHLKDKTPEYYYTDVLIKSNRKLKDFI